MTGPTTNEDRSERMLKWFQCDEFDGDQQVSEPFEELAKALCDNLQGGSERTVALRKLLESRDAAIRALRIPGG